MKVYRNASKFHPGMTLEMASVNRVIDTLKKKNCEQQRYRAEEERQDKIQKQESDH